MKPVPMPSAAGLGSAASPQTMRPPRDSPVHFGQPQPQSPRHVENPADQLAEAPPLRPTDPEALRGMMLQEYKQYDLARDRRPAVSPTPIPRAGAEANKLRNPRDGSKYGAPADPGPRYSEERVPPAPMPIVPAPVAPKSSKAPEKADVQVFPPGTPKPAEPLADSGAFRSAGNRGGSNMTTDADVLMRTLVQRLRDNPQDLQAHLNYQLLRYIKGEDVPDLNALAPLPQEDREYFAAVMDTLRNLGPLFRDPGAPSRRTKVLMELADRLRSQADLTLPTVALCSTVSGFGIYDPMPTRFLAGTDHPVIVYCEVENFLSKLNERQMWETKLSLEVVLYTVDGVAIWSDGRNAIPADVSRNRRHDFFVIKRMTLPRTLALGRYVLKVSVVDEYARRVAENNLEITMTAQ